jgi:hypothetical protein
MPFLSLKNALPLSNSSWSTVYSPTLQTVCHILNKVALKSEGISRGSTYKVINDHLCTFLGVQ